MLKKIIFVFFGLMFLSSNSYSQDVSDTKTISNDDVAAAMRVRNFIKKHEIVEFSTIGGVVVVGIRGLKTIYTRSLDELVKRTGLDAGTIDVLANSSNDIQIKEVPFRNKGVSFKADINYETSPETSSGLVKVLKVSPLINTVKIEPEYQSQFYNELIKYFAKESSPVDEPTRAIIKEFTENSGKRSLDLLAPPDKLTLSNFFEEEVLVGFKEGVQALRNTTETIKFYKVWSNAIKAAGKTGASLVVLGLLIEVYNAYNNDQQRPTLTENNLRVILNPDNDISPALLKVMMKECPETKPFIRICDDVFSPIKD
ncbi:MAG: hypothetical protein NTY22_05430 [Proteobacteria bacterium]|nr:hypothetical protein [Pseudomonadota bacterium]